jgi:hypothetical protein
MLVLEETRKAFMRRQETFAARELPAISGEESGGDEPH